MFKDFFHRLLNPHCDHCIIVREQQFALEERKNRCRGCETLTTQLDFERAEKQRLLELILNKFESNSEAPNAGPSQPVNFEPINKVSNWPQMRANLERQSRLELARINAAKDRETDPRIKEEIGQEIENLENELGVKDA